ncbi:MAG TPA: GGDEF domain-containing protein [Candidatus Baltobacteraceae bacterium]|nr:GGDEF domain-containing protein [Candidatus Baltobacteraceae bacterium]
MSTALLVAFLLSAVFGAAALRSQARLRAQNAIIRVFQAREDFVLDAVRALLDASRRSSAAVVETLALAIRRRDPAIDAVLVFAPNGEELECVFADGPRVEHYASIRLRRDADHFLPARAALIGHRASGCDGVLVPTDRQALAVPMSDSNGLRAVIYVSSCSADSIDGEETIVRTIQHAASPYALALERELAQADATYDGLTGLLTPRAFRTRLRDEIARTRFGAAAVLTLWFVDTDRFKSVNDTYGHAAGDAVLQGMAELLRAHAVPEIDLVARNGGDEFCVLIHDAQKTLAIERAQAFCETVRRNDFSLPMRITASVGVASFPHDARDANELLEVADAAMYHSKRTGRDRVSFAVNAGAFAVFREGSVGSDPAV